jgi:hypothetical protein
MKIMDKLSTYAALLGVIGAIGGGFYTWGQFNSRLDAIEATPSVDLSPLIAKDKELANKIAMIPPRVDLKPILEKLQMLEEYGWELEEDLEELSKQTAIVSKENELQDVLIEEIKLKADNPLAN